MGIDPEANPYGALNGRSFAWGPRELIWIIPATLIALIIAYGVLIAVSPVLLLNVSLLMIPFVVLAVATPSFATGSTTRSTSRNGASHSMPDRPWPG